MIENMRNVNVVGRLDDIDRVIEKYIAKFDIQLEYASRELSNTGMQSYSALNPYADALHKVETLVRLSGDSKSKSSLSTSLRKNASASEMTGERAIKMVDVAYQLYDRRDHAIKELVEKKESLMAAIEMWEPFEELSFDIKRLDDFRRICYRFGRMPAGNFKQFEAFLYNDSEILFVQGRVSREYIWGVYFVPEAYRDKVDSIFSSLHFERIDVINELNGEKYSGTPSGFLNELRKQLDSVQEKMRKISADIIETVDLNKSEIIAACSKVRESYLVYDIKKYAARTQRDFFVFVGWMTEKDAAALEKDIETDDKVILVGEGEYGAAVGSLNTPPTKLRNPRIIRFFEFFVKMYGLPSYNEIDPTPFMAITYTLLFGIMFGDVGQGGVIALLGIFLYRTRKMALGAIMGVIGVSSMVFGFLYGSVFGFEDIIPAVWTKPGEDINSTLIMAVVMGVFLIVSSMAINIYTSFRRKDWNRLLFSPNGLAGILFYGSVVGVALLVMTGRLQISAVVVLLIAAPLILIGLREPLTKLLQGKKKIVESGLAMFILETFIELFEVVLTYFTNTLSFIRVGAFALSHAGMMSVVLLLSKTSAGTHNIVVLVLGNILVMALEGLVVGIQVLRLEFYEMFSRFYEGGGREFQSYK